MNTNALTRGLLVLLICTLLLTIPMTAVAVEEPAPETTPAAETTTNEGNDTPEGLAVLFVLLGIAGVTAVGGAMIARDNFHEHDEEEAA